MQTLHQLAAKLRALFGKRKLDAEMDEEMRAHIDLRAQSNVEAGMNPEEARFAALRAFGRSDSIKEKCREQRGISWIENSWRDLRYAFRQLRKHPGFTAVAVLSLALGIGANTSIFSLVNAVLLRSLPLPNPHELRVLKWSGTHARVGTVSGSWSGDETGRSTANAFSYPVFSSLRTESRDQAEVIGYFPLSDKALRGAHEPFVGHGSMVSDNYFSGLEIRAQLGRLLSSEDNLAGAAPTVVVSHRLWDRELDGGPEAVGKSLLINGHTFTVVGVLPADFPGITPADPPDFYVPMSASRLLAPSWSETAPDQWWVQLMARLKPGTTGARFQSVLNAVFSREASSMMQSPVMVIEAGSLGPSHERQSYRKPLLMLLGVVGIVLLVACANLAGLLFARGAARRHELAVCAAMGASRWRLMLQSLSESLLLAVSGGALGILLALWGRAILSQLLTGQAEGLHYDLSLDARVLGFTSATVIMTALLSGLLPAVWNGRVSPLASLNERSRSGLQRPRLGRILVTAQIGLSALLLVGALLYVRTLLNLTRIRPGFDTDNLVLFQLDPGAAGYDDEHRSRFYDQSRQALTTIPGVRSVAFMQFKLLAGTMSGGSFFTLPGFPTEGVSSPEAYRLTVSEAFFDTMRIPVVQGRGLRASDRDGTSKVVVVNRKFVEKYFPGEIPIGRTLTVKGRNEGWQIVGVCADAKYTDMKADVSPTVYFSFRQDPVDSGYFALRTSLTPAVVVKEARSALASVDANIPLFDITTQAEVRDRGISQERLFALLCGALAGLAVLLCCIGIYGLTAYNVARRTGEIGIRMALGATRRDIAEPILREALLLGGLGVAIGIPTALALSRFIKSQLFGVASNDPTTLILAVATLLIVALLAAWVPARRAANVEPMEALRKE